MGTRRALSLVRNFLGFETDKQPKLRELVLVKLFSGRFVFLNGRRVAGTKRWRQARDSLPPLQGLEIFLGTVNPGRRSVLAHGHRSLCPGLLSVGLTALRFGTLAFGKAAVLHAARRIVTRAASGEGRTVCFLAAMVFGGTAKTAGETPRDPQSSRHKTFSQTSQMNRHCDTVSGQIDKVQRQCDKVSSQSSEMNRQC